MTVKDILKMDSRKKAPLPPGIWPIDNRHTPTVSSVKRVIQHFDLSGATNHSASGVLLGYVVAHCVENNIPFKLTHSVGQGKSYGYYLERQEETPLLFSEKEMAV
jgi:hypothetical protein